MVDERNAGRTFSRRRVLVAGGIAAVGIAIALKQADRSRTSVGETGWEFGVPIPLARSEMAAAVIDGRIYVVGGFGGGERLDRFDPAAGRWEQLADLPEAVHHPGVAALNGLLYVAGGYSEHDHSALSAVWAFDPALNAWSTRSPLPRARGALGLAPSNGALFAIGGAYEHLGGQVSGDVLRFDPIANEWEAKASMPTPREHLAVVASGSVIFAIGGRANGTETSELASANERFDPEMNSWTELEPLPVPRGGLSGVNAGGSVIVIGGERGITLYDDVNLFEPARNAWRALPALRVARHGAASAFTGGRLYVIAGSTKAGRVENTSVVEMLSLPELATPVA